MTTTALHLAHQPDRLETSRPPSPKTRDPWFDNAKMLLVTLVVVGHGWELLRGHGPTPVLYDFLYLFHVPAFVMVTGYLSRSFTWCRRDLRRLVTTVAIPYVVFESALGAFRFLVGGEELDLLLADPHWPMWYLAALFLWRLATPALKATRSPLLASVVVCLLGGMLSIELLDMTRATGLLPFFVIGLLATPKHLELLRASWVKVASVAVILVGFVVVWSVHARLDTEWLYWRSSYAELETGFVAGVVIRLALLAAATAVAVAFLAVIPRTRRWFTALGPATLVVYLFHGFFIKALEYTSFPDWSASHPLPALILVSAAGVALALTLAAPPVARRLNTVVDPVGTLRN